MLIAISLFLAFISWRFVEKPFRPGRKTVTEWMKFVVENQFTLPEIESGKAFEVMRKQII